MRYFILIALISATALATVTVPTDIDTNRKLITSCIDSDNTTETCVCVVDRINATGLHKFMDSVYLGNYKLTMKYVNEAFNYCR